MGFFDGVTECNERNGGVHLFGSPEPLPRADGGTDYAVRCAAERGGCGVTAWGGSPEQAMDNAQRADRAHRAGKLLG